MDMVMTGCPRARRDLAIQEVGKEGLLYDREGELIHILNVTALEIWKVCDGTRDLDAIEAAIRPKFTGMDGRDARGDIERIVTIFDQRGLLEGVGALPAAEPR